MPLPELEQPCPMCGEPVTHGAIVCAHCGELMSFRQTLQEAGSDRDLLLQFRQQMRRLSSCWLICGTGFTLIGVFAACAYLIGWMSFVFRDVPFRAISWSVACGALGILMLVIGFGTRRRQRWATYLGLLLSFGVLALSLVYFSLLAIAGVALMQLQTLLAIRTERKLNSLGIPLDTKL